MNNLRGLSQSQVQAHQQAMDMGFRQQYPTYITSNFGNLSIEPGASDQSPLFPADYSVGMESKFVNYSQEPHYR